MIKHKGTYQIISPEDIGLEKSNGVGIVLGKLSGRQALRKRLEELGFELKDDEVESVFWHFKEVAEKKKRVTDEDLRDLVSRDVYKVEPIWKLGDFQVTCGNVGISRTTMKLVYVDGTTHVASSVGNGPVDSAFNAVNLIVKEDLKLLEYSIIVDTKGLDLIATTHIVISNKENNPTCNSTCNGKIVLPTFSGSGARVNVVLSSIEAYIAALNKMLAFKSSFI
ncbi:putative homocitrate synthase [Lupinus albus]|uniref:Putative homocitrate synthase n=1 Tax=Lupinus albus TaxID=3870 RepID=A0A6A4NIY9_LUPAL|nr:putative homocitrate synthase [Lupinus albus]